MIDIKVGEKAVYLKDQKIYTVASEPYSWTVGNPLMTSKPLRPIYFCNIEDHNKKVITVKVTDICLIKKGLKQNDLQSP